MKVTHWRALDRTLLSGLGCFATGHGGMSVPMLAAQRAAVAMSHGRFRIGRRLCLVASKRDAGLVRARRTGSEGRVGHCLRPPVRSEKYTPARYRFRPPKPDYARTIDARQLLPSAASDHAPF